MYSIIENSLYKHITDKVVKFDKHNHKGYYKLNIFQRQIVQ